MDQQAHAKLLHILNPNLAIMDSLAASKSINRILELINALEWQSKAVDQNVYDDLNDRYSNSDTINERLKLLANIFDQDTFLLSIIDQLRDRANEESNVNQLYAITLDYDSNPLSDDELQDLMPHHGITIRKVTSQDADQVIQRFKKLLTEANIKY